MAPIRGTDTDPLIGLLYDHAVDCSTLARACALPEKTVRAVLSLEGAGTRTLAEVLVVRTTLERMLPAGARATLADCWRDRDARVLARMASRQSR